MSNKIKIGLFGFGIVGQGLYHVLKNSKTVDAEVVLVCDLDESRKSLLPKDVYTQDPEEILNHPDINLVVELINDADAAYKIDKAALLKGKSVVSANKKMLAYHLDEFIEIQKKTNAAFLYEASACGSIPIIRNLEEYYDNDLTLSVSGILNGSSNYILTKIFNENLDYHLALKQAQDLGFAESNPSLDVDGWDSMFKLIIITLHSFGVYVHPDNVFNFGISNLSPHDIQYAKEKGVKIKLVGEVKKSNNGSITMFVMPKLVYSDDSLFSVENQFNGVVIEGMFYDKQFMFGKGAGGYPTGSAVLSDITARAYDYKYEYKKQKFFQELSYTDNTLVEIYLRYFDDADLALFNFTEVLEKYLSQNYKYIVGKISLSELLKIKSQLMERDLFIINTGK